MAINLNVYADTDRIIVFKSLNLSLNSSILQMTNNNNNKKDSESYLIRKHFIRNHFIRNHLLYTKSLTLYEIPYFIRNPLLNTKSLT